MVLHRCKTKLKVRFRSNETGLRTSAESSPISQACFTSRFGASHGLKASTVRTLLRRLEEKGYVTHDVDGRTYVYRATVKQTNVATSAVRTIVDKFCAGSVENLLVGLVDDKQISSKRLQDLANQIAAAEAEQAKSKKRTRKKRK